jgi:hypothetical protein
MTLRLLYGSSIFLSNILNYKDSPIYNPEKPDDCFPRIAIMSGVKTIIYTSTASISSVCIIYDAIFNPNYKRHFVPFSVYGNREK